MMKKMIRAFESAKWLFIFLIILYAMAVCNGADVIVDGSGAGDYTTIVSAIEGAATGSTLLIKDTTGGGCTNGVWNEAVAIAPGNTENLTISPHPSNTYPIIIRPTNASAYPFSVSDEDVAGTYTFNDITFDTSLSNSTNCVRVRSTKDMVFNDCTFVLGTSTDVIANTAASSNPQNAALTFNNCSASAANTSNQSFIKIKAGTIVINGGTYDWSLGNTTASGTVFNVGNASAILNSVEIKNASIIAVNKAIQTFNLGGVVPRIEISGNVIHGLENATYLINIGGTASADITELVINNNTLTSLNANCYAFTVDGARIIKATFNDNHISGCRNGMSFSTTVRNATPKYLEAQNNNIAITGTSIDQPFSVGTFVGYAHQGTATGAGNDYILLSCDTTVMGDDYWNGAYVRIIDGNGVGQIKSVIDYDKTGNADGEKYAQVDSNWATLPDDTSIYLIKFDDYCEQAIFRNNTITNTVAGDGIKAMSVFNGVSNALIEGNYITIPGGERGLTIRATNAVVKNNIIYGKTPFYWQGKGHCDIYNNTFVSNLSGALTWRIPSNIQENVPVGTLTAYNNIFYASGAGAYCIQDFADFHNQPRLNNNCYYYTDGAKAGYLNSVAYDTFAELQAKWATAFTDWGQSTFILTDNDSESFVADPKFTDIANGDFRTRNPVLWNGGFGGTYIGAIPPEVIAGGGRGTNRF